MLNFPGRKTHIQLKVLGTAMLYPSSKFLVRTVLVPFFHRPATRPRTSNPDQHENVAAVPGSKQRSRVRSCIVYASATKRLRRKPKN